MAFNSIPANWIAVGKALKQSLFQYIKDNFDDLDTRVATVLGNAVPNGSFELLDPSSGNPVNWDINLYAGGSFTVNETGMMHGKRAVYFTSPGGSGNGGGYATSDYQPCSPYMNMIIRFLHYSDAGIHNLAALLWYDKDKIQLSGGDAQTIIYDSAASPYTPTSFVFTATPPAGAMFCKVRIFGAYNDNATAGSSFWDDVYAAPMTMPVVASGTLTGLSIADVGSVAIRTGHQNFTNPWSGATPFAYSAMVQAAAGTRDNDHPAALWRVTSQVFIVTGFETGGPNAVDGWYRGDVGILATFTPLSLLPGDQITSVNWVLTKNIG